MSETLGHDPSIAVGAHEPSTETIDATRGPESRFDEFIEEAQMAYHGIRARISDIRQERAANRMERMDHKDALYMDLGTMALTGERSVSETATGERAMPKTAVERFMDRRIDKKGYKKAVADVYKYRAEKVFGPEATLPGKNKKERKHEKRVISKTARRGGMLAGEARVESTKVDAQKLKLGEGMHKRTTKNSRRAERGLSRSIEPLEAASWREKRRQSAIEGIKVHHNRAERRRARIEEIEHARYEREFPEDEPVTVPIAERHSGVYDQAEDDD